MAQFTDRQDNLRAITVQAWCDAAEYCNSNFWCGIDVTIIDKVGTETSFTDKFGDTTSFSDFAANPTSFSSRSGKLTSFTDKNG